MRALGILFLYECFLLSQCVTINRKEVDIISKKRVELSPLHITAVLNDIVVISAPVVCNAQYYLYKPSGEAIKLKISKPTYSIAQENIIDNQYDSILITYSKYIKAIVPLNDYKVFNLHSKGNEIKKNNTFVEYANDFMIGPLIEEDHGNWVLSAYTVDENDDWNEMFRVISIEIREYIPPKPRIAKLREGDKFEFSFAHPIKDLISCELTAPRSTFDRFYQRAEINMDYCSFIIPNITRQDQGTWRIVGVGKIVYTTQVYLEEDNCYCYDASQIENKKPCQSYCFGCVWFILLS